MQLTRNLTSTGKLLHKKGLYVRYILSDECIFSSCVILSLVLKFQFSFPFVFVFFLFALSP